MRFSIAVVVIGTALLSLGAACGADIDEAAVAGKAIATRRACVSCHSVDGSASVGPTWKNLYGSTVPLDDGSEVVADEVYLNESMLDPSAKTVRGFEKGRMETVIKPGSLSEEEVRALIAYIESLR